MKKGKVIAMPTSVEAQIRTRARNLPIDRCYVSSDWEESRSANVIVTRKHTNGNITYGLYLVDLLLLGLIDCSYAFNELPAELENIFDDLDDELEECEYALAHNVVYESIVFAQDHGFKPVKDFTRVGKYILEEDTEDIPQMDIPVGEDGIPVVVVSPDNDKQREIAILEKTVGDGNFIIYHVDEDGNVLDDDEYDEDEGDEGDEGDESNEYIEALNEIINMGIDDYVAKYGNDLTSRQILAVIDIAYQSKVDDHNVDKIKNIFHLILEDNRFDPELRRLPILEKYIDDMQVIVDKLEDDKDAALTEMAAFVAKHPDDVDVGMLQISLYNDFYMKSEVEQLISYWYNRAPEHYVVRLFYAGWLSDQERFDEMFELFGNLPGLDALTTEDVPFTEIIVSNFCAFYVLAWLSKDNIAKAEPYYRLLLFLNHNTPFVGNALLAMMTKKRNAIMKNKQD